LTSFDFTLATDADIYGDTLAFRTINGKVVLRGGNTSSNTTVSFTGINNDVVAILGLLNGNQGGQLASIYSNSDLNFDGIVKFTGFNNDVIPLLSFLSGNQAAIVVEQKR
jgi:hypothetical protein